jgi:hypothetical protein
MFFIECGFARIRGDKYTRASLRLLIQDERSRANLRPRRRNWTIPCVLSKPMIGGMGVVNACHDLQNDRAVALKTYQARIPARPHRS